MCGCLPNMLHQQSCTPTNHSHYTRAVVAGLTGVRTVDVGSPQWAMHSVRECMATSDVVHGYRHFKAVYQHFSAVAAECAETMDV